jgi:hypothetical protein
MGRSAPPLALLAPLAMGALLLVLGAWLLAPLHGDRPRALRVCVLDTSASVWRRDGLGWDAFLRGTLEREARAAQAVGEDLCCIAFDGERRLLFGPGDARGLDARALDLEHGPSDLRSDLSFALAFARRFALDRPGGHLRLMSDRRWTGPDPGAEWGWFTSAGFECELVPPPPRATGDLSILEVRLPESIELGAPLAAEVRLGWAPGARSPQREFLLAREIENADGIAAHRTRHELPSDGLAETRAGGIVSFAVTLQLGPARAGRTRLSVEARLADGSAVTPENDRAVAESRCGDGRLVAVVSHAAEEAPLRAWWPSASLPGLQPVFARSDELGALLHQCHAVVSVDLPPSELPVQALESFVKRGGGWLAMGGWELSSGWESGATEALPLEPDPGALPERDVILLVDGSGSMEGAPFEALRAGAIELALHLHAGDRLSLRFFRDRLEDEVLVLDPGSAPESRAEAVGKILRLRSPGGPTDVAGALEALIGSRRGNRAALVLLLTDGRDQPPDQRARLAVLRARLRGAAMDLALFAAGERANREYLGALLIENEELHDVTGGADLARLFRRELERARTRANAAPTPAEAARFPSDSIQAELLRDGGLDTVPFLERFWLARGTAPGAGTPLWRGERGEPVLAVQRHGLGLGAVWTSQPLAGWSPKARVEAFGPLLRALSRGREDGLRLELEGDRLRLENVPSAASAVLRARLSDTGASSWKTQVLMTPPAVGWPGNGDPRSRRLGTLDDWPAEVRLARADLEQEDGSVLAQLLLAMPSAPEWAAPIRELPAVGPARSGQPGGRGPHPAGPAVLALGLAALALAAFLGLVRG